VVPLDLESDANTPFFGDDVNDAVTAYNTAAAAYDRMSGATTERIDAGDLGVSDTLVTIAPGLELGAGPLFFRVEGIAGYGSELRTYGLGVYPLNVQLGLTKDLGVYASLGGTASYLTREGTTEDGALISARAAGGVRIGRYMVLEVGYSAYTIGGIVDESKLRDMVEDYNGGPPPDPDGAVAAGEAKGLVDVSVGVSF
jgi:hypothetical protein